MADYEDVGVIAVVHWRTKLIDSLVARRLFPILVFGVFHFWFSVHFFVVALRPFLHLRFLSLRWPVFFFLNFSRGPSTVLLCVCVCVCVCVGCRWKCFNFTQDAEPTAYLSERSVHFNNRRRRPSFKTVSLIPSFSSIRCFSFFISFHFSSISSSRRFRLGKNDR